MRYWLGALVGGLALVLGLVGPWQVRSVDALQLDLDRIFPCAGQDDASRAICDEARGIIMFTCQGCHPFMRTVYARFGPAGWAGLIDRHRSRVAGRLTDEQLERLQSYLTATFRPGVPPPELPPGLVEFPF